MLKLCWKYTTSFFRAINPIRKIPYNFYHKAEGYYPGNIWFIVVFGRPLPFGICWATRRNSFYLNYAIIKEWPKGFTK